MKSILLTLGLSLMALMTSHATLDVFLKFEGGTGITKGDSLDNDYPGTSGWFQLDSYSFGITNTVNVGSSSGGLGSGRAQFEQVCITKAAGEGSAKLILACAAGNQFSKVTLVVVRSASAGPGSRVRVLQMEMHLVVVQSVTAAGADGDDSLMEKVVLVHGAQKIEFFRQKQDGSEESAGSSQWSQVMNTPTTDTQ